MKSIDKEQFAHRIQALMPALMHAAMSMEKSDLTSGKLTVPQFGMMVFLARNPSSSMKAVAEAMNQSMSSVSGLVDRAVQRGWVQRERSARDRRVVRVGLTAEGRKILEQVLMERRRTFVQLFAPLNGEERARYLALLEKVVANLDDGSGMPEPG